MNTLFLSLRTINARGRRAAHGTILTARHERAGRVDGIGSGAELGSCAGEHPTDRETGAEWETARDLQGERHRIIDHMLGSGLHEKAHVPG